MLRKFSIFFYTIIFVLLAYGVYSYGNNSILKSQIIKKINNAKFTKLKLELDDCSPQTCFVVSKVFRTQSGINSNKEPVYEFHKSMLRANSQQSIYCEKDDDPLLCTDRVILLVKEAETKATFNRSEDQDEKIIK